MADTLAIAAALDTLSDGKNAVVQSVMTEAADRLRGLHRQNLEMVERGTTILRLERNNAKLAGAIEQAIRRLTELSEREGGPTWVDAKKVLSADLFLLLDGLQKAVT